MLELFNSQTVHFSIDSLALLFLQDKMPENQAVWQSDNQGVKEETFIQTGRRGGDGQPGQRGHMARYQLEDWKGKVMAGSPTFVCCSTGKNNWGARQIMQPKVTAQEEKASQPLIVKTCGGAVVGKTPNLTGEFVGETHRVLECMHTYPPSNKHQKGPICLWAVGEVIESCLRAEQAVLFSL